MYMSVLQKFMEPCEVVLSFIMILAGAQRCACRRKGLNLNKKRHRLQNKILAGMEKINLEKSDK